MKVVLVLFEQLSGADKHGFAFMGSRLARALRDAGLLGGVIALQRDATFEAEGFPIRVLDEDRFFRIAMALINRFSRFLPFFNPRAAQEKLFDRFTCGQLKGMNGDLLFFFRPLFPQAVKMGRKLGWQTWIQASIPHPLANLELVRQEELRLGLPRRGPYSDEKRARRLTATIAMSERLLSIHPEVGKYAYDTYAKSLPREKIIPLKNFITIDPNEFAPVARERSERGPRPGGVRFLHVSHMNLIKGIPYLLDAWRLLKAMDGQGEARLTLVGQRDANLDRVIKRDYADLTGLEVVGWVPDLLSCLGAADVFVSPSISDNGPGTIAEAMAAGMPVISSLNCGMASLITPEENGFTYPFDDVNRLAEILRWFTANPDAILPMGASARERVSGSSADRYADELVAIINAANE